MARATIAPRRPAADAASRWAASPETGRASTSMHCEDPGNSRDTSPPGTHRHGSPLPYVLIWKSEASAFMSGRIHSQPRRVASQ